MISKLLTLFLLSLLLLQCKPEQSEKKELKQPNVLLIIGDDHGNADLGFLNEANDVKTPHFDRLAEMGTYLKNAYATSPICSPSRVGLMTGSYHQRQEVFWYGGNGLSNPDLPTIAEVLRAEGYATGYFGKFHYGSKDTDTSHRSFPLNHGYKELFGCNGGRKHYLIHNNEKEAEFRKLMQNAKAPKQSLEMGGFWVQKKKTNIDGFATELIGEKGRAFMKRQKENKKPFFATVSFNAVHNFTHQLPQEYLDKNRLKGYRDWDPEFESYYEWYEQGRRPNNPEGREHYLGQLFYLDQEMGKIIDFLKEEKILENTLIIYVGDNGGSTQIYANNGVYEGGKYTMYDGGLRIPMIISWKGHVMSNTITENLVSAMDIFPTICDAIDAEKPRHLDGISLQSLLNQEDPNLQHETLVWYGGDQAAVRSKDWKYRWADASINSFAKTSTAYEGVALELGDFLHDLEENPGEDLDLKDDRPEVYTRLKKELEDWKYKVGITSD